MDANSISIPAFFSRNEYEKTKGKPRKALPAGQDAPVIKFMRTCEIDQENSESQSTCGKSPGELQDNVGKVLDQPDWKRPFFLIGHHNHLHIRYSAETCRAAPTALTNQKYQWRVLCR